VLTRGVAAEPHFNALKFTGNNGSAQLCIVVEAMPNCGSMDITPYTEVTGKDYILLIFFKDMPDDWTQTSPPASASPSSPVSQTRPSRPPLFTSIPPHPEPVMRVQTWRRHS